MAMELRPFAPDDIEFALAQTTREGWDNTAAKFRVHLAHDPDGCFIAEINGRRAGMVTSTGYTRSGWIGNLIVEPEHRRQGVGEGLMLRAIERLESCGIRTIRLEADPMGVNIYRRLGFVDQFESLRFWKRPPHRSRGPRGMPLPAEADMEAVAAFDRVCFGDDRGTLLRELLGIAQGAFKVGTGAPVEGFAMALPSTVGMRLGPWVARSRAAAEMLLESVLADFPSSAILTGVPCINRAAVELLESLAFARVPSSLRMVRGEAVCESDPDRVYAIATGAVG